MPGSRRRTEGRSSAARRRKQPPAFDPTRSPTPFFGEPMRLAFLSSTNSIKHSSPDSPRVAFNYKRVPTHLGWHSHPPEGGEDRPGGPPGPLRPADANTRDQAREGSPGTQGPHK